MNPTQPNNLTPMAERIASLHETYQRITGRPVKLLPEFERGWFDWIQAGFTEDDLRQVVELRLKGIRCQERRPACLCMRNVVLDLAGFADDLAQAQARKPQRYSQGKQEVLAATGRETEPATGKERPVREVFSEMLSRLDMKQ